MEIIAPVIITVLPGTADIVEKLRTLFHAAIEGVISVRRVLSNKLSDGKYQSNALSCTVDFAGQSFSTESAIKRHTKVDIVCLSTAEQDVHEFQP